MRAKKANHPCIGALLLYIANGRSCVGSGNPDVRACELHSIGRLLVVLKLSLLLYVAHQRRSVGNERLPYLTHAGWVLKSAKGAQITRIRPPPCRLPNTCNYTVHAVEMQRYNDTLLQAAAGKYVTRLQVRVSRTLHLTVSP